MGIAKQAADLARETNIIRDMLGFLAEHGFHIKSVYNGEEDQLTPDNIDEAIKAILSTDVSRIYFHENNAGNILIVLDHDMESGESISDWTIPADGEFGYWMDQFTQEIYREDGKYHG